MVDEIGSPGLQIYVHPQKDTAPQVEDIRTVGKRICALHSSALNPEIDYGQVFAALKEVGYDWYWCFEVGGDLIAESARQWRADGPAVRGGFAAHRRAGTTGRAGRSGG